MPDPTIPRGGPRRLVPGPTYGRFIDYGNGRVILTDRIGNRWSAERVAILSGSFGNDDEGVEKLPRPWRWDTTTGRLITTGDWVVIDFLDGSPRRPIVRGGVRPLPHDAFLARAHADLASSSGSPGRMRARLRPRDGNGVATGEVRLYVADDGSGAVRVVATDGVKLQVGPLEDGPFLQIDMDKNVVTVSKGGTALAVVLETLLPDLAAGLSELMAFANGLGVPTPNLLSLVQKLATSYRSSRLKAE